MARQPGRLTGKELRMNDQPIDIQTETDEPAAVDTLIPAGATIGPKLPPYTGD